MKKIFYISLIILFFSHSILFAIKPIRIISINNNSSEFVNPVTFTVLKDNFYLLDKESGKIYIIDKTGKQLNSFGGKGQGPGKFILPIFLLSHKHHIGIYDGMLKSIRWFSPEGKFEKDQNFNLPLTSIPLSIIIKNNSTWCLLQEIINIEKGVNFIHSIVQFDTKGNRIKTCWKSRPISMKNIKSNILNFQRFFTLDNNNIYISKLEKNSISFEILNANCKKSSTLNKRYSLIKLTENEKKLAKEKLEKIKEQNPMAKKIIEGVRIPEFKNPIIEIFRLKDGIEILYLKHTQNKPALFIDIFKHIKLIRSIKLIESTDNEKVKDCFLENNTLFLLIEKNENYFIKEYNINKQN